MEAYPASILFFLKKAYIWRGKQIKSRFLEVNATSRNRFFLMYMTMETNNKAIVKRRVVVAKNEGSGSEKVGAIPAELKKIAQKAKSKVQRSAKKSADKAKRKGKKAIVKSIEITSFAAGGIACKAVNMAVHRKTFYNKPSGKVTYNGVKLVAGLLLASRDNRAVKSFGFGFASVAAFDLAEVMFIK